MQLGNVCCDDPVLQRSCTGRGLASPLRCRHRRTRRWCRRHRAARRTAASGELRRPARHPFPVLPPGAVPSRPVRQVPRLREASSVAQPTCGNKRPAWHCEMVADADALAGSTRGHVNLPAAPGRAPAVHRRRTAHAPSLLPQPAIHWGCGSAHVADGNTGSPGSMRIHWHSIGRRATALLPPAPASPPPTAPPAAPRRLPPPVAGLQGMGQAGSGRCSEHSAVQQKAQSTAIARPASVPCPRPTCRRGPPAQPLRPKLHQLLHLRRALRHGVPLARHAVHVDRHAAAAQRVCRRIHGPAADHCRRRRGKGGRL